MKLTHHSLMVAVFFWAIATVCAGPGIQEAGAAPGEKEDSSSQLEQKAQQLMQRAKGGPVAPEQNNESESSGQDVDISDAEPVTNGEKPELPKGQGVDVSSFGKIDLHVKDLKLTKVLQLLSIQAKKNIIASKKVSGAVSADLYNVDFYEALDAILHPNGYGYRKQGNFIYVYTAEELQKIQKQNREKVHKIIELSYINAADASGFVQPLLSSDGSISVSSQVDEGFKPSTSDGGANSFAQADKLVIYDYKENVKEIVNVIEQLDTRPKQVLVEATILKVDVDEDNEFGVDFSLFSNIARGQTSPLSAVDDLISGNAGEGSGVQSTVGSSAVSSESNVKIGTVGSDGSAFVRALDSVTDVTTLATPKILVLNRQKADLLIGDRLGYLSTTTTENAATETVEFLEIGTQLTLRPFVSKDGFVRMELNPSVSTGNTTQVGTQGTVIPNETTQELTTNVIVESGQTVVLGGFFKEKTDTQRSQVPGLGEIPGLGAAFQGQNDTVERDEVIFLIQPTVMKDKTLAKVGDQMSRDIEDARLGAREGLLPWSRTKLTSSHMSQALKHERAGEIDKALWDVNLALYLDPRMVDAIQLKEKLTGKKLHFHDRSRMNDVIDTMIERQLKMDKQNESSDGSAKAADAKKADDETDDAAADQAKADAASEDSDASASTPNNEAPETMISVPHDAGMTVPSSLQPPDEDADSQAGSPASEDQDASDTDVKASKDKPASIENATFRAGPPADSDAASSNEDEAK